MYLCICKGVRPMDSDKHHLIGTGCGKCIKQGELDGPIPTHSDRVGPCDGSILHLKDNNGVAKS